MKIPNHEIGAAICKCGENFELGPFSSGSRNKVSVRVRCRSGCKPAGIMHTHPGGPVRLSNVDVKNMARTGLPIACVTDGKRMQCNHVKIRNK